MYQIRVIRPNKIIIQTIKITRKSQKPHLDNSDQSHLSKNRFKIDLKKSLKVIFNLI